MNEYFHALAKQYDTIKAPDRYWTWVGMSVQLLEAIGFPNRRLLDVGCGTGLPAPFLNRQGFTVTGCDISPGMLDVARAKGVMTEVYLADMRSLPTELTGFGVATWFNDVANHLLSVADLTAAFRSTAGALAPGGLLLFDVNNLDVYRRDYGTNDVADHGDLIIVWLGRTEQVEAEGDAEAELVVFDRVEGDTWRSHRGQVRQRHYSMKTVSRALQDAGLELLDAVGSHSLRMVRPANEQDPGKIFYIARKPHQPER